MVRDSRAYALACTRDCRSGLGGRALAHRAQDACIFPRCVPVHTWDQQI